MRSAARTNVAHTLAIAEELAPMYRRVKSDPPRAYEPPRDENLPVAAFAALVGLIAVVGLIAAVALGAIG